MKRYLSIYLFLASCVGIFNLSNNNFFDVFKGSKILFLLLIISILILLTIFFLGVKIYQGKQVSENLIYFSFLPQIVSIETPALSYHFFSGTSLIVLHNFNNNISSIEFQLLLTKLKISFSSQNLTFRVDIIPIIIIYLIYKYNDSINRNDS